MARQTPNLPAGQGDEGFDLGQIFIGRQQQLDLFEIYLKRWKQLILDAEPGESLVTTAPSPNNKIQGLVVLLFGQRLPLVEERSAGQGRLPSQL